MFSKVFCRILFLLVFLSLASVSYGEDTNVTVNPGFEEGTIGWEGRNAEIEASTVAHSGSGSAKTMGRKDNWQGIKQSMLGKMQEGKTYQISAWVKLENSPSDTVAISFEKRDGSGTNYYNAASATVTDSNWVKLSGEFAFEVTGMLSILDIYFEGPEPGVNFYVDDVNVYGPKVAAEAAAAEIKPKGKSWIDVTKRHQKIEGFGGSGAYYTINFAIHKQKDKLCNLLFKELGLDIFRLKNAYDINEADFNYSVEIAKCGEAALGRDLKILLTCWSPPARLKSNGSTIGGTLKKKDGEYMYSEFADWWYDSIVAYEKAGLKPDYITIQNEVDYEITWDSCKLAPTESSDSNLAGFNAALQAVWKKLDKKMGSAMPKILAPETMGPSTAINYIKEIENLAHIYGYAHHLYDCSDCGSNPDRYIPAMTNFASFNSKHGKKPLFQTEFEHESETWQGAMDTAKMMHNSLAIEGVAAYLYWDLFWEPGSGMISIDEPLSAPVSYTIKPVYYAFKNYSAFIHSGWQRVETSTDNTGLKISAYISPDNQKLTAVILNTTNDVDIALDVFLKGFLISKGDVYRSSENEKCVHIGSYDISKPLKLPADSITTLVLHSGGG